MSTKVGLFFAAAFPPALSSGNPGLVRIYQAFMSDRPGYYCIEIHEASPWKVFHR